MTDTEVQTEEKVNKSIVPSKYAGKYKGGGSDDLANFINEQCRTENGFEFAYFFDLCRKNDIPEEKVDHYEGLYNDRENNRGIEGRARMTLRNMLAARARKGGGLNDRDGDFVAIEVAKPAASGAAAKAQADAAADETTE